MTIINEEELEHLVSSANMFIVTPIARHNAWDANNELVRKQLRKREENKRNELRKVKAIAREIVQGLERGATLTTTRKRRV